MSCGRFEKAIALWVEGDLPPPQARRLEAHLEACPACREFAEGLRASQEALKSLAQAPADEAALDRVRQRVLARIGGEPTGRRPLGWVYALAGSLVAATVAAWLLVPRPAPQAPTRVVVQAPVEVSRPAPAKDKTGVLSHRPKPAPPAATEPLVVKLYTDDPDVVIYWLIEKKGD